MSKSEQGIVGSDEAAMPESSFTQWQLIRLRNALRTYHQYSHHDGTPYSWKDVSEAISLETGVIIPAERLRQFVEGFPKKDGTYRFPILQGNRLSAVRDFVLSPDSDLLDDAQFEGVANDIDVAISVQEYTERDNQTSRKFDVSQFMGEYESEAIGVEGKRELKFFLTLSEPLGNGILKATLKEQFKWITSKDSKNAATPDKRKNKRSGQSSIVHHGFAVLTPENLLLVSLKRPNNGRTRFYSSLQIGLTESTLKFSIKDAEITEVTPETTSIKSIVLCGGDVTLISGSRSKNERALKKVDDVALFDEVESIELRKQKK